MQKAVKKYLILQCTDSKMQKSDGRPSFFLRFCLVVSGKSSTFASQNKSNTNNQNILQL